MCSLKVNISRIKRSALVLLASVLLLSTTAFALTLDEAKLQGRAGETLSGYLAPIKQDAETLALIKNINEGRKQQYQQVAQNNQVATNDVAKLAGQKLVARAGKGEWVKGINGQWLQK